MAQLSATPPSSDPSSESGSWYDFLFDVRFLGVVGQIAFVVIAVLAVQAISGNLVDNLSKLGEAQFICGDGSVAFKCAYDFLQNEAGFDISDTLVTFVNTDPYYFAIWVGILNTLRVAVLGFILTTIVGVFGGIARLSNNWLLSRVALWFVEITRNTPILVQLFLLYFGVLSVLPNVQESIIPFGLPVFFNNRGLSFPGYRISSVTAVLLVFVSIGYLIYLVVAEYFARREVETGKPNAGSAYGLIAFGLVTTFGWTVSVGLQESVALFRSSTGMLIIFVILAIVTGLLLWQLRGFQEERTGIKTDQVYFPMFMGLVVLIAGYTLSRGVDNPQVILVPIDSSIQSIEDFSAVAISNAQESDTSIATLADVNGLDEEGLEAAAVGVCVLSDSVADANVGNQFGELGIPLDINRSRTEKNIERKIGKNCDYVAANSSEIDVLLAEVDNPEAYRTIPLSETPLISTVPSLQGLNVRGGIQFTPEFAALLLGLTLFYGGQLAEIVRAGIQSVNKGQTEAALSLGLSDGQRMSLIVLPQALRVIIPPAIGVYLSLAKDTSLGIGIGFQEMYSVTGTTINQSGRAIQLVLLMMAVYLTISIIFSLIANFFNERMKLVER